MLSCSQKQLIVKTSSSKTRDPDYKIKLSNIVYSVAQQLCTTAHLDWLALLYFYFPRSWQKGRSLKQNDLILFDYYNKAYLHALKMAQNAVLILGKQNIEFI